MKSLTELKVADLLKEFNMDFKDHWEMYETVLKAIKKKLIPDNPQVYEEDV